MPAISGRRWTKKCAGPEIRLLLGTPTALMPTTYAILIALMQAQTLNVLAETVAPINDRCSGTADLKLRCGAGSEHAGFHTRALLRPERRFNAMVVAPNIVTPTHGVGGCLCFFGRASRGAEAAPLRKLFKGWCLVPNNFLVSATDPCDLSSSRTALAESRES
jgi:hypothetical protein